MKRKALLLAALSLVLMAGAAGAAGCDTFSAPPRSSSTDGLVLSQQNTGIWVNGEGKVSAVPDVAILSLGVEAQAATIADAQNQAATAMDAVVGELDNYGVAEKDIKTRHFSIYPVRKWVKEREEELLVGYRVSNMVTVKVRKVDDTGVIIDAVAMAGGDYIRINDISFTVDDPEPYYKEAREKAMADAEAKAKQLADSGGVKLGTPTYINESSGFIPAPRVAFEAVLAPAPAPAPTTSISPGETEIRITVQVVYSIR
ncbi:SIMPL domain-containing protein [Chloroflexota bacterium]